MRRVFLFPNKSLIRFRLDYQQRHTDMSKEPTENKPEVMPSTPDPKPQPTKPEIPADKDTPQKDTPIKAS